MACAILSRHQRRCTLSSEKSPLEPWLSRLDEHLNKGRYSRYTSQRRTAVASRFLAYLNRLKVSLEIATPSNVDRYLHDELRLYWQRHHCAAESMSRWRYSRTVGTYMLVRVV